MMITKVYTITGSEDVMRRFEKFLCFLHYNGGHSGIFGMEFDGDGPDKMRVYPAPDKGTLDFSRIADSGHELEVAYTNCCRAFAIDHTRAVYKCYGDTLSVIYPDGKERVSRVYE